jgi:hypothetical protein
MRLFLFEVGGVEGLFLEHDELPLHGVEHVELDLVNFVLGLGVDEEVLVVEEGVHQQIGAVLDVVDLSGGGLDEHVLRHIPFAFPQQHPAVQPLAQVQVGSQLIGLIVVDGQSLLCQLLLHLLLVLNDCLIEGGMGDSFGEDVLVQIELLLYVLVLVGLPQVGQKVALHQGFVLGGDLLGSDSEYAVGVVAHSNQEGAQQDAHVETVALLPSGHIGRRGYNLGELVRRIELLVLDKPAESLCAFLVIVQL